jgi:general transcription factor 3C polypeptide 5 (transcription factor C subunit 1)
VGEIRNFKFDLSRGVKKNDELIPPPIFSDKFIPFNWAYAQNPLVQTTIDPSTGQKTVKNKSKSKRLDSNYIHHTQDAVPDGPKVSVPNDPMLISLIELIHEALELRPIWTRRALVNHLGDVPAVHLFKHAIQYVGYQFRGGPWRDGIIKFGLDPRKDIKCRVYQTVFFKLYEDENGARAPGDAWQDHRSQYTRKRMDGPGMDTSHLFDGTSVSMDGKIWQLCDITDPILHPLIHTENLREECDADGDGWYLNGVLAKIKAIMRTKIGAIRIGREMNNEDFDKTFAVPDHVPGKKSVSVPVPDWKVNPEQAKALGLDVAVGTSGMRKRRMRGLSKRKRRQTPHQGQQRELRAARKKVKTGKDTENIPGTESVMDARVAEAMKELVGVNGMEGFDGAMDDSGEEDEDLDEEDDEEGEDEVREDDQEEDNDVDVDW